jgi:hypothetical protein
MSFALLHQSKNKAADSKISMPPKRSAPHHHINNLAMDSYESINHLQRMIGNQAVQRLMSTNVAFNFAKIDIQLKLKVSQPGDPYEQEADLISDKVMHTSEPQLQHTSACGAGYPKCQTRQLIREHERLQTNRLQSSDIGQIVAPLIVH